MERSGEDIERLIAGTKRDVVPDLRHRGALRERVLAEYDKSGSASWPAAWLSLLESFWGWAMARPIARLGIPVVLIAVVAASFFSLVPTKRGLAFEKMVEPLLSAKSGRCRIIVQLKDKNVPAFTFVTTFRGTVMRQESKDMGTVMIVDEAKGTTVSLYPKEKRAEILQLINRDPAQPMNGGFLQQIRALLKGLEDDKRITERVSLGEREIADGKLIGYRIRAPGSQMDIWGDQATGLPHTIVTNMAALPNAEMTMTDFEFDIELDDSQFSLTPPAGYTVTRDTMDMSLLSEKGLIAALRQFAEINDGVFPDSLNLVEGMKLVKKREEQLADKPKGERDEEISRLNKLFAAGFSFPFKLPAEADATYAGRGVHLDDAEKPIFWYKPEGANKYHIVLADLSVIEGAEPPQVEGAQEFNRDAGATNAE